MKNRGIFGAIAVLGVLGIVFYIYKNTDRGKEPVIQADKADGFFIWMDAYVALPVNSDFPVALTYYYFNGKDNYIHKEDITAVAFEGTENVTVKDFQVQDVVCESSLYRGYSINLTIEASEMGQSHIDEVHVYLDDGTDYVCPLGAWYFDVDTVDSGFVNAYGAAFATSSAHEFNYNYMVEDDCVISELQYWYNQRVTHDVKNSGVLPLENEAPFNYIKAKGLAEVNGETSTFYGLGCYCGILNADVSDIELSYERNRMN